jgi:hypothetical protein
MVGCIATTHVRGILEGRDHAWCLGHVLGGCVVFIDGLCRITSYYIPNSYIFNVSVSLRLCPHCLRV